jgi:2-dehydropantoate 2-reductase
VALGPDDVLVATAQTQQLGSLLPDWADATVRDAGRDLGRAGERLPIVMATNGVAAEDLALRYFGRVFGVCVWSPAARLVPGEVVVKGTPVSGVLHVGRVPTPSSPDDEALLAQLDEDWTAARFTVHRPPDVMPWKYRKLISNLGNVFEALVGTVSDVKQLLAAADAEAREVLDAAGIVYTSDEEEAAARATGFSVRPVPGVDQYLGGSTWQSLTRSTGDVETDYLNGEIAAIAHRHGLAAPLNDRLSALGRAAARRGSRPGDLTPAALTEIRTDA